MHCIHAYEYKLQTTRRLTNRVFQKPVFVRALGCRQNPWGDNWEDAPWQKMIVYVLNTKTLESPLDCKEIKPVHPKGGQSWIHIGRADAEAEAPILWPPDAKDWLIGKDPDAGKDWRWEEKGTTDGWMASPTWGVGDRQGGLECYSPWGCKESDTTEQQNWTEMRSAQSRPTLCNPRDCSPPGYSVHGILQARILERVAVPVSRGSSQPRDRTWVSCIAGRLFTVWATREAQTHTRVCWGWSLTKEVARLQQPLVRRLHNGGGRRSCKSRGNCKEKLKLAKHRATGNRKQEWKKTKTSTRMSISWKMAFPLEPPRKCIHMEKCF